VPPAAVICFIAFPIIVVASSNDLLVRLGTFTAWSAGLWFFSWAFAALSVLSLMVIRRRRREVGRAVMLHSAAVALACTTATIYLTAYGVIGIRLWAY